jgi:alpha-beta hydrolase superfamily lysophospholipase
MTLQNRELESTDDHIIKVYDWHPSGDSSPLAVIQVLHGLGEHAARYERFAKACNDNNLIVVAHNHRGHGAIEGFGHYADADGWGKVIADVLQVRQDIAARYAKLPVVLLGHSMGSYIAQSFVMRHGGNNVALVLSASTLASRIELRMGNVAAAIAATLFGKRRISKQLNQMGLGKLNNNFRPNRTGFDWLSRDEDEVDRYVCDPLCGGQYSNQLWYDLTGGMLEITSRRAIESVRADLPILILGGERDPVGGQKGLTRLADAYRQTGHNDLTLTIYPQGRHEMLNETNRDEVTNDIINWVRAGL